MNVSLQTSFKTLIIYCCVSTFMILNNKDALLLADEMNSPSANSYNTQQDNPQKLDEAIFKELPKKTNNIYLDVRDKDDKKVEVFDEKGRLIFNSKNQVYLEIKLSPHTKIENYQFLTSNSQPLPFVTKSNDDTTTIRILLKQNIQTLEMRYKQNLHDKEDSVLFIHLKQNKDDKEDQKDKNQNQIIVQQNKNNNQQTRTTDKDISKNKKTGQNKPKEYKNSTQEQKNKSTTTNINVTKNSNSSHTQSSGNSNNNDQSLKNNVDSQSTKIQSTRDNIKKEKDKTLPSFNRDDDVKKHKPNNKKYENNQKAKSHKKEYAILGVAIVLAMLLLVVSHLLMRKRGKKRLKHVKTIILGIICAILLVACESSSKSKKEEKAEKYRIVPTTVALTMTLDKLDLPIVGKPTSYKTLPTRYKDVPEVGQPMQPSVEAVKKLNPTHVLSVSTIKDEMKPFYKQLNMKGYYYDYDSLQGMENSITELGKQFNRTEKAKELNDHLNKVKKEIEDKAAKQRKHPKVLILMGVPGSYLVATDKSYIGDLVKIAGGENVIKVKDRQYISSNTENLLNVDPDIILRLPHGMPDEVKKMFKKEFKQNDIWKHFKAVKNNKVYDLEEIPFGITANVDADEAMKQLYDLFYNNKK